MKISTFFHPVLFVMLLFLPIHFYGQYFDLGQDPASLKWRQVKSDHFQLVYPVSFEPNAHQFINTLEESYNSDTKTLAFQPSKIPVIIHNYNTIPNAVTAWAPKRIEIYTTPPQDSYAQNWLDQLAIHEFRHVVQLDRTNQGFTKVLSWFTGEQAASMVTGLFVPTWFLEGDAVCAETAHSNSGRGRIPSFEMLLRTQIMQKGAYSYDKAAMGSYKSFVPNQYVLGYSLVANIRRNYGYQAWISALDEVARKPFLITPFNIGLKKATGYGKEKLYKTTMFEMDSMWNYQKSRTNYTAFTKITESEIQKYENYTFPYYINDSIIISLLSSMDDISRFVVVSHKGYKEIVCTPGFISSDKYSVSTGRVNYPLITWCETINDPRWEQRNYSVVRMYNSSTGKITNLTKKSRYFSPSVSNSGRFVAVVHVDEVGKNSILLIETENGNVVDTIVSSKLDFYMTPSWSDDDSLLVYTVLNDKGKCIKVQNYITKACTTIVQPTFTEIANPVFADNYVLFNGSYTGIENVFAFDLEGNSIFQVTSAEFGACNADISPDRKKIVYSDYTSSGYGIVEADFVPASWKPMDQVEDHSASLYKYLVEEENSLVDSVCNIKHSYQSQPYKKAAHIFNFHSWAPIYLNYMSGENSAGVSFMSQNSLSTAFTVVGYSYDFAENTGKVTADFSWKAWYPLIDFNTSYGARAAYTSGDTSVRYNFNEAIVSAGLSLPLLFTGGKYYKGLKFQLHSSLHNITNNTSPDENKLTGTINSLDYSFSAYRFIKQSHKDIYPRWGQTFNTMFRHSPFGDNNLGSIFSIMTRFYFPGFIQHHGFRVDLSFQHKNVGDYSYNNQIYFPRGYLNINAETIKCFSFNYKFPFLYPDIALGPITYIKRIKANLFYDGGQTVNKGESSKLQSVGVEVTADLHFLRILFPFDIGYRFGYRPMEKQYFGDLLFSVNLSN